MQASRELTRTSLHMGGGLLTLALGEDGVVGRCDVGADQFDGDGRGGGDGERGEAVQAGQDAAAAAGRQHVQHLAVAHQRHLLVPLDLHHSKCE